MYHSAEMRWFFEGEAPADVRQWFERNGLGISEPKRTDEYLLLPGCKTTSVKVRDGRLEVKALTEHPVPVSYPNGVDGLRDAWVKWSGNALDSDVLRELITNPEDNWVFVEKSRHLRVFSLEATLPTEVRTPASRLAQGCQVELTAIRAKSSKPGGTPMAPWWSLSFEAFGSPASLQDNLDRVAHEFFREPPPIRLEMDDSMSYPVWLGKLG